MVDDNVARRRFLQFVASSPYVAALGGVRVLAQRAPEIAAVMADPKEAFSVMDFEEAARRKVSPSHFAFMASGVDDDATLRANREGYGHIKLRPRRLRDATKVDMRTTLYGATYSSPIYLCPTGSSRAFHPDGELAIARAAKARGTMMMLSASSRAATTPWASIAICSPVMVMVEPVVVPNPPRITLMKLRFIARHMM